MNILILLVIVFILITAAYVGYNVTQRPSSEAEGHSISVELQSVNDIHESIQNFSKANIIKSII